MWSGLIISIDLLCGPRLIMSFGYHKMLVGLYGYTLQMISLITTKILPNCL